MRQLSLTVRLSLMFMLAVGAMLLLAGVLFYQLSRLHFDELDRHALDEKLRASETLLARLDSPAALEGLRPELDALLALHGGLVARILDDQGRTLYRAESAPTPGHHGAAPVPGEARVWRRGETRVTVGGQPLRVELALDVTAHSGFFVVLAGWLWGALLVGALASGLLGWLVARNGLRPLREMTQVAASVSARSLTERLPDARLPAELRPLVQAFNGMLDRLEDAFVRLSNFSADIAHELRTPLSNLMTQTEVALTRARSPLEYQDALHSNLEELQRMARMIDDMLFLAKADNGLIVPGRQRLALRDLCEGLLEFHQLSAEERGILLRLDGEGWLEGDAGMLRRALSNLLSNALAHTADGGCVRLSIRRSEAAVTLAVGNPGAPIPVEHRARLFDRFYRVDPARRAEQPGNAGLGLAITRSIVEAHRGRIACRCADGWNWFDMTFPTAPADA